MKMPNNFIKKMSDTILKSLQEDKELQEELKQQYNDYKNDKDGDNNE